MGFLEPHLFQQVFLGAQGMNLLRPSQGQHCGEPGGLLPSHQPSQTRCLCAPRRGETVNFRVTHRPWVALQSQAHPYTPFLKSNISSAFPGRALTTTVVSDILTRKHLLLSLSVMLTQS